jgi:PAS domain S-box-containing protein
MTESFKPIFENKHTVMLLIDPENGDIKEANPAACSYYGWSYEQMCRKNITEINTLSKEEILERMQIAKKEEHNYFLFKHRLANGEVRDVEVKSEPIDFRGSKTLFIIITDKTDLIKAEKEIKYKNELLTNLIINMEDGILLEDTERNIILSNQAFCNLFSIPDSPDTLVGVNCSLSAQSSKFLFKNPDEFVSRVDKKCSDKISVLREELEMADGRFLERDYIPIFFENRYSGHLWRYRDITLRKQIDNQLKEINATLENKIEKRTEQLAQTNANLQNEIEERKRVETELALEKGRLSNIIKATNVATWEWNVKTGEVVFDERWAEIIGYTLEEISPANIDTWKKFCHPEDLKTSAAILEEHFKGDKEYYSAELRMKHKSGDWVWILDTGKVITWTEDGKPIKLSGIHLDINEKKKNDEFENELLKLSLKLTGIPLSEIKSSLDLALEVIGSYLGADRAYIFELERDKKTMSNTYEWCNLGITPAIEELKGLPVDIFPMWMKTLHNRENIVIKSVHELPESWDNERKILEPQGVKSLVVIPMLSDRSLIGFVGLDSVKSIREYKTGEITTLKLWSNLLSSLINHQHKEELIEQTRKKTVNQIKAAKQRAELANKAKSDFIATMSHEIRTPLNAILGYTELLGRLLKDKRETDYLGSIKISGKLLLTIINDLLDLSKIEAGKIEMEMDYVDTYKFFYEFEQIFNLIAHEKKLEFTTKIAPATPLYIYLDASRLRQVMLNLVGNAVKFTEVGGVAINVMAGNPKSKIDSTNSIKEVVDLAIEISDTGIGIPKIHHEKIFESFVQLKSKSNIRGTGLGLPISKKLITLMNGNIIVESEEGKGSVFKITLKDIQFLKTREQPGKKEIINSDDILFKKATILIVDDLVVDRKYISDSLVDTNITIIEASDGRSALECIRKNVPDLVITDIRMAGMDGFELLSKIKEDERYRDIPVIAYTASVMNTQKSKIREDGFADLLVKPVMIPDLFSVLRRHLPKTTELKKSAKQLTFLDNIIVDRDGLTNQLEGSFTQRMEAFKFRQPIKEIIRAGEDLTHLGEKHKCSRVIQYGKELVDAGESINIKSILQLIQRYEFLIYDIKNR